MTVVEKLQATGIHRLGTPKRGFRWRGASRKDLERLQALAIPPAWTDVAVSRSPGSKVQAIGKDKAGRWQYRYGDQAVREREQKKYDRLVAFARALPRMRARVDAALRLPGLPREKVMACILRILSTCFMRPGSDVYAKENGSFGIATLRKRHVDVRGDVVHFDYEGKSGKQQVRELRDRQVARIIRELMKLPGRELFQFRNEASDVVDVHRNHINDFIKETMGDRFSAKDFRTWAGTMICANILARMSAEVVPGVTDRRKMLSAAVKETATHLGNTPAVCKSSYIWPSILSSAYDGKVLAHHFETVEELISCKGRKRGSCEKALLELLAMGRSATPILLAKKRNSRKRRTRMSQRMQSSPKLRKLARAFTANAPAFGLRPSQAKPAPPH
ncbi:MAG: DNA topoisomerase IB [Myxococcales bacterium]